MLRLLIYNRYPKRLPIVGKRCLPLSIDVSKFSACEDAVNQTVNKFGPVNALCHFAAIHSTKNWEDVSQEEFLRVQEVNVVGSFNIAKAVAAHMKEQNGGAIVLTSSGSVQASEKSGAGPAAAAPHTSLQKRQSTV